MRILVSFCIAFLVTLGSSAFASDRVAACISDKLAACEASRTSGDYLSCAENALGDCGVKKGRTPDPLAKRIEAAVGAEQATAFNAKYAALAESEAGNGLEGPKELSSGPTVSRACKCSARCQFVSFGLGPNQTWGISGLAENATTCKQKAKDKCEEGYSTKLLENSVKCEAIPQNSP